MPQALSFVPGLLRLAWPVALARLGIMGMGLVDVIVVGQLAPGELAHQALGWAPTGVMMVTGIGLLTGVQILAARAIGEGNRTHAGGAWRRGMIVAGVAGLIAIAPIWIFGEHIFTVFGIAPELARPSADVARVLSLSVPLHLFYCATAFFLEAIQRPMASTIVMWGANIVNLVLNLWFVPLYGAEGSAWATFGARVVLAGALAAWIFAMPDGVNFGVRFKAQGPRFGSLLRVGAAAAVSQMAEAGAFSAMTIIAGRIGETAVSAYQILLNVLAVVFMVALGMSTATAVLTSEAVGRRSAGDAARASWTGLGLNTLFMGVLALVVWIFAAAIARGYTSSLEVVALVAALMWIAAAVFVPDGGQVVAAQALRARGDNWFPTASHIVSYVVVMPPLAFYLGETLQMGVAGLMLAIFWASVLSVGILTLRMWWIARRGALPPAGESVPVSMGH